MENIKHYINDGANWQAQAVLAIIRGKYYTVTDNNGFDYSLKSARAKVDVGRYENGREQGYVFGLYYDFNLIKYYAVYEHRNSDRLCILTNTKYTINTPSPSEMFGPDRGKYDTDADFRYGSVEKASEWILTDMQESLQKYFQDNNIDIHDRENKS